MELIKVEAVLMNNGEIICNGKTIGWEKDLKKYIEPAKSTVIVEVSGGVVVDVKNLPRHCEYELLDHDNEE